MSMRAAGGDFLTAKEAAVELGFAEDTVRRYINKGLIRAEMFGNTWAVPRAEVERYRTEKRSRGRPSIKKDAG